MTERFRSITGWKATLFVVVTTALVAILTRLPWLANSPPGFSLAEVQMALDARDHLTASDIVLPWTTSANDRDPLFQALIWLTGSLFGWEIVGPRLAAAFLGIVTAVVCCLWYRRVLGVWAGLAGGLLVATAFPLLVLSRQAQPGIAAAAVATLGLYCLWEGLGPRSLGQQRLSRGWWVLAAGLIFGFGVYFHPSLLPALIVVPASSALLVWRCGNTNPDTAAPGSRWLIAGLASMLLIAAPFLIDLLNDPADLRQYIERDWTGDGRSEQLAGPTEAIEGFGATLLAIAWDGHDAPTLGTPGRALLDPILIILSFAGLIIVIIRPLNPLHGVAICWLIGFSVPSALIDPGNPALLMPLTPVLFLLPLIALDRGWSIIRDRSQIIVRTGVALATVSIAATAVWSLIGYWDWTRADRTYFAFHGDLRTALAAVDRLAPGTTPVYVAAPSEYAPLLDYLGPPDSSARIQRPIDGQTTIVIPPNGVAYVVTTESNPLPAELSQLFEGQSPVESGETSSGTAAWQIWVSGQATRDGLPWTLPAIGFPDGFELVGFDIRPDLGDVATTGRLPDPPRVIVTLVWDAPRGATPHLARVRLLPIDDTSLTLDEDATIAESWLTTSPPIEAGNRGRELIVTRMSVPVPDSLDLIVEVQAGLLRSDGSILPPTDAGANAAGDYARLNRVQYVRDSTSAP